MSAVFFFKKLAVGLSYGVSFPLTVVLLDYWLKDCGAANSTVGLFSLFHLPFVLKIFFAPIIDEHEIPFISRLLNKRRSWVIVSQAVLIVSVCGMAQVDPRESISLLMFFASLVALADGMQNIALYPYQISDIAKEQFGYTAGIVAFGHRIGMIATKVITLYCAHFWGWKVAYQCSSLLIFCCMIFVFFMKEPKTEKSVSYGFCETSSRICLFSIKKTSGEIKKIFHTKNGLYTVLVLIFYRAADFVIQKMSRTFCLEIGFSKLEIANIVQFFGSIAAVLGGFLAGFTIKRTGTLKGMIVLSATHTIFLTTYALLNYVGNDVDVLCIVVFLEGFSGGAVAAAFIAFLYENCKNGSQYALLWAIHELGGMCFRLISGFLADQLGWTYFFMIVPLFSIPGIALTLKLSQKQY